jgi:hypothetical protein
MGNNYQDWEDDDFFDDDVDENSRPKKDDLVSKLRRAERAKDKQLKELQAELESLRKFQRESVVTKVLQEKGVNPKIAAFIPADLESSDEAISNWLSQYGEIFGVTQQQPKENINQEDLAALRQIDSVTSGALSPDDFNSAAASIDNAQSMDELISYLYSQGLE